MLNQTICLRIGKCCDFTFKTLVGTEAKYIPQHTNQVTIICTACSPGDSLCDCDRITDQQSFDDCCMYLFIILIILKYIQYRTFFQLLDPAPVKLLPKMMAGNVVDGVSQSRKSVAVDVGRTFHLVLLEDKKNVVLKIFRKTRTAIMRTAELLQQLQLLQLQATTANLSSSFQCYINPFKKPLGF